MADGLPIRKFVKVKLKKRENRREGSTSYALRWPEHGQRRSLSLGPYATRAYAEWMRSEMEAKLNAPSQRESVKPARWKDFVKEYLDQTYPGHDLPTKERKPKEK